MLKGKTVVLGVTGSIAAYKIANLASALVKLQADVNVIMTKNATNFINPITFETLTGNKCLVDTFDREVGLGYLKAIHLNDSKNPFASHKDRHEVIGAGALGLETFRAVVNHPKLKELPFILETPQPDNDGYMREIAMVRGLVRES